MILPQLPPEYFVPLFCVLPFVVMAGWSDFSRMVIPNSLVLISGTVVLLAMAASLPWPELSTRVLTAVFVFVACCAMFALRALGGGDTKFLPVVFLAVPTAWIEPYLVIFGLSLGATVLALQLTRIRLRAADAQMMSLRPGGEMPVGVSMALSLSILAIFALTA